MLTLGNIINWERLRGKRFDEFDGEDAEDVLAFGYVTLGTREYTLNVYKDAATNSGADILTETARAATAEFAYISQFLSQSDGSESSGGDKESITEIAGTLISGGMDGNFILSRGLEDLQWICKAYQQQQRRQMETSRFWSYIQLSPWIDRNKARNAGEFLPFAWEKTDQDPTVITELEKKMAKALFNIKE